MTATREVVAQVEVHPVVERRRWGALAMKLLTTTDHKVIGNMYFVTSLVFFVFGRGAGAGDPGRAGLPGPPDRRYETYNQFFTMHGSVMLLLFAVPDVRRVRQLHRAAADRRARHGLPAPQRVLVLALPVRLAVIAVSAS